MSRILRMAIVVGLATAPAVARADAVDEAKKLLAKGWTAHSSGKHDVAIAHYKAAAFLVPVAPGPDREMARCYDDLGNGKEALAHYRAYLEKKPDAEDRAFVLARIEALDKLSGAPTSGSGRLRIDASPDGALVFVDGKLVGKTPLTSALDLTDGEHALEVQKEGFESWSGKVRVRAGAETLAVARLSSSAAPPALDPAGAGLSVKAPEVAPAGKSGGKTWLWVVVAGVAVAAAAAAGILVFELSIATARVGTVTVIGN